ncbi:hypothetical protein Dda_8301 [Drechslerella dactyloides]|uniref:Uncharacterized protein n=1 Tax=Drechslerella dactyloides TaxID=74499 RepID=A0AAD6NFD4_DREDA|nr:hypothetical protein Dda_8301 [Drechslerella dactyloides]
MRTKAKWIILHTVALQWFMRASVSSPIIQRRQTTTTLFSITFDDPNIKTGTIQRGDFHGTGFDFSDFTVLQFKETTPPGSGSSVIGQKNNYLRPASAPNYIARFQAGVQDLIDEEGKTTFQLVNELLTAGATFSLRSLYFGCFAAAGVTQGNLLHGKEPLAPAILPVDCTIKFRSTKFEPRVGQNVITIEEAALPEVGVPDGPVDGLVGTIGKLSGGNLARAFGFGLDSIEGSITEEGTAINPTT